MRNVFAKSLLAAAVAGSLFGAAGTATADVSASFAASNMYLWRGITLSTTGGVVSGSLDYAHDSGFYAGIWTSSETDGHETDLYAGFAGEIGGLGYDVGYAYYMYPEEGVDVSISDSALADVYANLTYGPVFLNLYQQVDSNADEDLYYQVGFTYDKFTAFYGGWDLENNGPDYSHVQVDFAATDNLSFSVSKAFADDDAGGDPIVEEDPLFAVTYSLSFDL
ncbi:MAG TPA: hypothetical protein ENN42_08945 [Thioalkalivibrio sp.]|nr:hypothetical protein [Thioalkalivibrio sp.]